MKIFVIIANGAQVDLLSLYGFEGLQLPNLENLASQGLVLDKYFASSLDRKSIQRAWLKGNFPFTPEENCGDNFLNKFSQAGWQTHFFSDGRSLGQDNFQIEFNQSQVVAAKNLEDFAQAILGSSALNKSEKSLIWIENASLLPPWDAGREHWNSIATDMGNFIEQCGLSGEDDEVAFENNPGEGERIETNPRYLAIQGACMAAWVEFDSFIGNLVVSIQNQFADDEWALFFLSDRAFSLGQHGKAGLQSEWLFREYVHLPFLCYVPKLGWQGKRRLGYFQDIDLAPSLMDLAGIPAFQCHGTSIFSNYKMLTGARSFAFSANFSSGGVFPNAYRTTSGSFLAHSNREEKFFLYPDDRLEMNNLVQAELEQAEIHRTQLQELQKSLGIEFSK